MTFLTDAPFTQQSTSNKTIPAGTLTPNILPRHARFFSYHSFKPGESLSSWFIRLASANMVSVRSIWTESGLMVRPIDADMHPTKAQWLVIDRFIKTATEREHANDTQVISFAFNDETHVKYLARHNQKPIFRFCPCCLSEGEPYFRAKWRLGFYVMCEKHHVIMSDRCDCGHPLNLNETHERSHNEPSHYYCYCTGCGRDLRQQKPRPLPGSHGHLWIKRRQDRLWNILAFGGDRIGRGRSTHIISMRHAIERCFKRATYARYVKPYEFSYRRVFNRDIAAMFGDTN